MKTRSIHKMLRLPAEEEVVNSLSHGIMAAIALLTLPFVSVYGYLQGGWTLAIGNAVFVIAIFLMLLSSTLFHAMAYDSPHKTIFRILDHSMIYVAIAGSYTPIALYAIGGKKGFILVLFQWALALIGISYKVIGRKANPLLSVGVYLLMGWSALFLIPSLLRTSGTLFVILIALGGVFYSLGTYFYIHQRRPYYHFIWHLFINAGVCAHFIGIIFIMP